MKPLQPLRIDLARAALDENYILLLTTNSVERKAMNGALASPLGTGAPFEHEGCALGQIDGRFILHVTGTSGAHKPTSVDRIVRNLLDAPRMPRPCLVLLAGIAWGAPNKTVKGDVVLSGEVLSVSETRKVAGKTQYRDLAHASPLLNEVGPLSQILQGAAETFRVHEGRLASAPTHYGDDGARDELLVQVPSVLGGEMEAFGLVPDLTVPWLILRSVSDFGEDGVNRLYQYEAADHIAKLLRPLVGAFKDEAILPPPRNDEFTAGLSAALAGRALEIARPDENYNLLDYLNTKIGPTLDYRLRQYIVAAGDDASLADGLTSLLLEKAQNAFRHGNAQRVVIGFNDYSVDFADDGAAYDLFALQGDNGGAVALRAFQEDFVEPGLAKIAFHKAAKSLNNAYRFEFTSISRAFHAARSRCLLTIDETAVVLNAPFEQQISFPTGCDGLFYDLTETRMTSIHVDRMPVFRALLQRGKSLFLLVRSPRTKRLYETELADCSEDRLTVFVAPH